MTEERGELCTSAYYILINDQLGTFYGGDDHIEGYDFENDTHNF